jgi:hypothetical protein
LPAAGYATVIANADENPVIASMNKHGVSGSPDLTGLRRRAGPLEGVRRTGIPTMHVLRQIDALFRSPRLGFRARTDLGPQLGRCSCNRRATFILR